MKMGSDRNWGAIGAVVGVCSLWEDWEFGLRNHAGFFLARQARGTEAGG